MNVRRGEERKEGRKGFVISRGRGETRERKREERNWRSREGEEEEMEESQNRSVKWILGPSKAFRGAGHFSESNGAIPVPFLNLPS